MVYIGIDNGLDGGIVVLDKDGAVLRREVMPTIGVAGKGKREYYEQAIVRILTDWIEHQPTVFLERAQAMPKQGVSSTFSIGKGYGTIRGILAGLRIPYEIVGPRDWQKVMFSGIDGSDTKRASAVIASRLAPSQDWKASERCKNMHDGMTDAFCIAEWGRRKFTHQ